MSLLQDLRYAARLLRREPGYAAMAILTMALGIGATTALFSVAYGVMLKPLPWPDADQIVRVTETRNGQGARLRGTITNGSYLAWSEAPTTIEAIGGYSLAAGSMTLRTRGSDPQRVAIARVTPTLFDVLKAVPHRGRLFNADDARIGSGAYPDPQVMILSHGLWHDWYGGREDAIGSTVRIDEAVVTIVGVMPPTFEFPDRETRAWLPMPIGSVIGDGGVRRMMIFGALARVKPDYTLPQVAAEATARARTAPDPGFAAVSMFGTAAPPDITVTSAADAMTADVKPAIAVLLAAVVLLLLTATANVAGLQLVRATTRRREIALRAAIGASQGRLMRQLIVETGTVVLAGGLAGVLLALALHRVLTVLLPADFPRVHEIAMNPLVLLFAVLVSVATSVGSGLLPALHGRRVAVVDVLAESSGTITSATWRSRGGRMRSVVMAGQVAVACLLLVGAALLGRSFVSLMHADRGYDPVNLLTARVDLSGAYDGGRRAAFADAVVARVRQAAGVTDAGAGNTLPFVTMGGTAGFSMPSPIDPGIKQTVQTMTRIVSPSYFDTLRLRLVKGRLLTDADTLTSRPVIVVNRTFMHRYLGSSPIGMRVPMPFGEGRPDCDVVGVVEDMRQGAVTDAPAAELYVSYRQMPQRLVNGPLIFVIRTTGDPLSHAATLRTAVREHDASAALDSIMTMEERIVADLAKPRLYAVLLGSFGVFALVIAGVGLFGVLSYAVAQRYREFGVRTALGARTSDVVWLVVKHAAAVAGSGLVVGLVVSLASTHFLSSFLYGVSAFDVWSFVTAAGALGAATIIACLVPARRAARVDAVVVLKSL